MKEFRATKKTLDNLIVRIDGELDCHNDYCVCTETPVCEIEPVKDESGQLWKQFEHTGDRTLSVSRREEEVWTSHPQNPFFVRPQMTPVDPVVVKQDADGTATLEEIWEAIEMLPVEERNASNESGTSDHQSSAGAGDDPDHRPAPATQRTATE